MIVRDKTVVVTGGGAGIGRALAVRFARDGAKAIVVADLNGAAAATVADQVGGTPVECDVGQEGATRISLAMDPWESR